MPGPRRWRFACEAPSSWTRAAEGPRQVASQAVGLAVLISEADGWGSVEALADLVRGKEPSRQARRTLHMRTAGLRNLLEQALALDHEPASGGRRGWS